MPATATIDPPVAEHLLDDLVPPPGPRWKRLLLWVAFLGLVAGATWSITSGTVVPKVTTGVNAWGGSGPVGVTVSVDNESRVDLEIVDGPATPPGLELLGVTTGGVTTPDFRPAKDPTDPFPIRLGPHETIQFTTWYEVTDCQAIARIPSDDDTIELKVRIASGPASAFTAERTVDASDLSDLDLQRSSWPAATAKYACPAS